MSPRDAVRSLMTFRDDRGRAMSVLCPLRSHKQEGVTRTRSAGSAAAVALFAVSFLFPMAGLTVSGYNAMTSGDPALRRVGVLILLGQATTLTVFAATCIVVLRKSSSLFRRMLLRAHRCPGCGYALRGLAAGADGATVCAECGAAWKLGPTEFRYGVPLPIEPRPSRRGIAGAVAGLWRHLITIADDRGFLWPSGAPAISWSERPRRCATSRRTLRFITEILGAFVVLYAGAFGACWAVSEYMYGGETPPVWVIIGTIVGMFAAVGAGWLGSIRLKAPGHIERSLAAGRCAVCGGSLVGKLAEADGLLCCSDCGAAWRAERLGDAE